MTAASKIRKPVKGLRVKLRAKLIELGYIGKFTTTHTRNNELIVTGKPPFPDMIMFQGHIVRYKEKL